CALPSGPSSTPIGYRRHLGSAGVVFLRAMTRVCGQDRYHSPPVPTSSFRATHCRECRTAFGPDATALALRSSKEPAPRDRRCLEEVEQRLADSLLAGLCGMGPVALEVLRHPDQTV